MANDVGERLVAVAEALFNGNKAEFARQLEMAPPSFTKYTSGRTMPGGGVLQRISRLGVNIHWLLTGEGNMLSGSHDPGRADPVVREEGKVYSPEENGSAQLANVGSHQWLEMVDERSGEVVFKIEITMYAGPTMRFRTRTVREE